MFIGTVFGWRGRALVWLTLASRGRARGLKGAWGALASVANVRLVVRGQCR